MFNHALKSELAACQEANTSLCEFINAIESNIALIEFSPDGVILTANELFLQVVGYKREEVVGQHHRMFCDSVTSGITEYRNFWQALRNGQAQKGAFARINKAGHQIWLESTYFPVRRNGSVYKIIKFAADITEKTIQLHEQEAILSALNQSLGVITFTVDGEIESANENFLNCVGYRLDEIRGKHHRMFCLPDFYQSNPNFWAELKRGQFKSGRFERVNKQGQSIWLEATYNPINGPDGNVVKIIKVASDISARVRQGIAVRSAAHTAHEISDQTKVLTEQGADLLQQTVENAGQVANGVSHSSELLQRLAQQSKEISAMVTTIRSIAEQTNLLALNAAIEAARAGDYGRGFAVVADEVRNLAARTSSSTVDIENVVKRNSDLTNEAAVSMAEAMSRAQRGTELVNEAHVKIGEIRSGAEHVWQTIADLELTQQN